MILEIADIKIKAGQHAEFEQAVQTALMTIFPKAKGPQCYPYQRRILYLYGQNSRLF